MKTYFIRFSALTLAAVLSVSMLASCGEKTEKTDVSEPSQTMQNKDAEEIKAQEIEPEESIENTTTEVE